MGIKKEPGLSLTDVSSGTYTIKGIGQNTGDDVKLYANHTDAYDYIFIGGNQLIQYVSAGYHSFVRNTTEICKIYYENSGGYLALKEVTDVPASPTATMGYLYTKSDNKLYFIDGGGTNHEVAFV